MRERLLLLAAALAAFGASLGSGFHFDDYAIFSDPVLTSPGGWLGVWAWRQTRPLTYFTYWLNYRVGGHTAWGYHLVNLLLHLAAVWLLYECLRRILPQRPAWFATAIFAVHPLQAEAVDYIWGRSIVLAGLLCFAALYFWIAEKPWVALVCFAAALLAKEECAAFPLILLLLPLPRPPRGWWAVASMLLLALAAGGRVAYVASITPGAQAGARAGISPLQYFLAQSVSLREYAVRLTYPISFSIDPQIDIPSLRAGLAAWALELAVAVVLWRKTSWGVWLAAGTLLLLPSSSIFPAADLAADRRMYLPVFAIAAGLTLWISQGKAQRALPVVVIVLVALGFWRTHVWNSDEALWREALACAPQKVRPRLQLARDVAPAEALQLLDEARQIAPQDPAVATETGRVLMASQNPAAALGEFGRALALNPGDANNYNNRGVALAALGQTEAARQDFERALKLDPQLTSAQQNLRRMQGR